MHDRPKNACSAACTLEHYYDYLPVSADTNMINHEPSGVRHFTEDVEADAKNKNEGGRSTDVSA